MVSLSPSIGSLLSLFLSTHDNSFDVFGPIHAQRRTEVASYFPGTRRVESEERRTLGRRSPPLRPDVDAREKEKPTLPQLLRTRDVCGFARSVGSTVRYPETKLPLVITPYHIPVYIHTPCLLGI